MRLPEFKSDIDRHDFMELMTNAEESIDQIDDFVDDAIDEVKDLLIRAFQIGERHAMR